MAGMDFAKAHMAVKGWDSSRGLGKHEQGITDAIKPKLKFDQAGMGHNKAEEFEFQWWDHVFNKAAKTVKVEEGDGGEVKVDFCSSKDELSTKKIRKKAAKAMKAEVKVKLYSNFVRSGTLTGGVMDEQEEEGAAGGDFVEDTDLSKLRTLTDDELVKACGGRTAHKGGRHGHKMNAKLARIEQAEAEYMENYRKQQEAKELQEEDKEQQQEVPQEQEEDKEHEVKIKKKKKKHQREEMEAEEEKVEEPKKKKKSNRKAEEMGSNTDVIQEDLENLEPTESKKKKKSKKEKIVPTIDGGDCDVVEDESEGKLRKKKKKKLKRRSE